MCRGGNNLLFHITQKIQQEFDKSIGPFVAGNMPTSLHDCFSGVGNPICHFVSGACGRDLPREKVESGTDEMRFLFEMISTLKTKNLWGRFLF